VYQLRPCEKTLWLPFAATRLIQPTVKEMGSAYKRQMSKRLWEITELTAALVQFF
jgi:hypothetical protein